MRFSKETTMTRNSRRRFTALTVATMALVASRCLAAPEAQPDSASPAEEEVTFQSNGYTLAGCIVRPDGPGPFPAVIYNHGSERNPRRCGPPELERAYVEHGYAFFAFQRHGHGQSPGDYIVDLEKQAGSGAARGQRSVALHEAYNRDVVGAVEWLMRRPEIDRRRVAMTGVSYGGIQTLLTAEKGLGIRAFMPFAPGAMSWANQALDQRLAQAVRNAKAPLFLAQAQNDFSLGPSQVLGPIIRAKGAPTTPRSIRPTAPPTSRATAASRFAAASRRGARMCSRFWIGWCRGRVGLGRNECRHSRTTLILLRAGRQIPRRPGPRGGTHTPQPIAF
jgi:dienelactone hydrolase